MKTKRILSLALCLVLMLSLVPITAISTSAEGELITGLTGSGTEGDPVLIASVEDWDTLCTFVSASEDNANATAGKFFKQTADLDFTGVASPKTLGARQTKGFQGTYDGNGKKISHIALSGTVQGIGLFTYVKNATIKNLTVKDSSITTATANRYMSLLVAEVGGTDVAHVTTIDNCHVENCTITGPGGRVGGLVGQAGTVATYATTVCIIIKDSTADTTFNLTVNKSSQCFDGGAVGIISNTLAASATSVTLQNVQTKFTVNVTNNTDADNKAAYFIIGGLVGDANGDVNVSGCTADLAVTNANGSDVVCSNPMGIGALAGIICRGPKRDLTQSFTNCTAISEIAGFGANAPEGALIGKVHSYAFATALTVKNNLYKSANTLDQIGATQGGTKAVLNEDVSGSLESNKNVNAANFTYLYGYQTNEAKDAIRFVAFVNKAQFDASAPAVGDLGFKFSDVTVGGAAKTPANIIVEEVYTSVSAIVANEISAYNCPDCFYMVVATITGIPADGDIAMTVTPFLGATDGNSVAFTRTAGTWAPVALS